MLHRNISCVGQNTSGTNQSLQRLAKTEGFKVAACHIICSETLGLLPKGGPLSGNQGLDGLHPPDRFKGHTQPPFLRKTTLGLDLMMRADLL